jgi:hypothetical protein
MTDLGQALTTIGALLAGGFISILTTWLNSRYQLKAKREELRYNASMRAREILFSSKQKRIETIDENAKALGSALGQLMAQLQAEPDKDAVRAVLTLSAILSESLSLWLPELEADLKAVGLSEARQNELALVKNGITIKADDAGVITAQNAYWSVMRALATYYSLRGEVLEKQGESLFSDYLKPADT